MMAALRYSMWHACHPFSFFSRSPHLSPLYLVSCSLSIFLSFSISDFLFSNFCWNYSLLSFYFVSLFFCLFTKVNVRYFSQAFECNSDTVAALNSSLSALKLTSQSLKKLSARFFSTAHQQCHSITNIHLVVFFLKTNWFRIQQISKRHFCLSSLPSAARGRWNGVNPGWFQGVHDLWDPPERLGLCRPGCQRQGESVQGEPCRPGHLCEIHYKRRGCKQGK